MSKPDLTPANVAKFTTDLYLLSDSMIFIEAQNVAADFRVWLSNTFNLTTEQVSYIDTYSETVNQYYGYLFAATIIARGQITFAAPPNNPLPRRFKETRANLFGAVNYDDDNKELTGTMDVTIEFMLL